MTERAVGRGWPTRAISRDGVRTTVELVAGLLLCALIMYGCGGGGASSSSASRGPEALATRVGKAQAASVPFTELTATRVQLGRQCLRVVVADTEPEREEGLRARADLGSYEGMLFSFPVPTNVGFTMSGTLVPLTIGFYDRDGRRVDGFRMPPCPGDDASCPVYRASGAFSYAVETTAERLPSGGLGPCG